MRLSTRVLATAALSAAWLFSVPAANAQNHSGSPKISDQKLDATAAAVDRVASIKRNYEEQLSTAASSDKERIVGDANNAVTKAISDQGLSIEEYTGILQVAQNDSGVRERLLQRLHSPAK
jgi:ribosome-binding protein aMBF1 (putative translation factor)